MNKYLRYINNPVIIVLFLLVLCLFPLVASQTVLQIMILWAIYILLAQSINLLTGFAGQISLGHAAFFAIGAYTTAKLLNVQFPFFVAIIASILLSALVGYLISYPTGRVQEFYLAMMTLGFGFLVYEILKEWSSVTGGVMGLSGIPSPQFGTLTFLGIKSDLKIYFWLVLLIVVLSVWALRNFVQSYIGRSFLAVHRSELSAASIGIAPAYTKRLAYTLSAGLAGLAGALYAPLRGYIGPDSFDLMRSIEILVMGILGGFGTLIGPILGAGFLALVPNQLQIFQDYQLMIYGILLVVSFIVLPKGFAGLFIIRTKLEKSRVCRKLKVEEENLSAISAHNKSESANLIVRDVVKDFDGLRALDHVSLEIKGGTILGLIGPNGSGKSTLVNLISGVYPLTSGQIIFGTKEITNQPTYVIAKEGITRTFQDPHNVPNMTIKENLLLGLHMHYKSNLLKCTLNLKDSLLEEARMLKKVDEVLELCKLKRYENEIVSNLPYGVQRMAEVARAILTEPKLLLLDEPGAGLSEEDMDDLANVIRYIKEKGVSIVLIDHHIDFVIQLVDEVVVLDSGKVIYKGDIEGMKKNNQVIEAYLGVEASA